jgi:diguanylate cyclase (GGDEF)-like protein
MTAHVGDRVRANRQEVFRSDLSRSDEMLRTPHERIRALYLIAAQNAGGEAQITATLELGCKLLGMELAAIHETGQEDVTYAVDRRSQETDLSAAHIPVRICRLALATNGALALDSLEGIPYFGEPLEGETRIGSFIGAPIDVAGQRYGSLSFAGIEPRKEPLEAADRDLVQLMTVLIGGAVERTRVRLHLRSLAYYDSLTGLPNRLLLQDRLAEALGDENEARHSCAVLFLDLDRFKDSNDTLGHVIADRLLQMVSERLIGCVRGGDTVARVGGDEFVVLLVQPVSTEHVVSVAQRLLRAFDEPFNVAGIAQYMTTSVGIAVAPNDGTDAESLIKHADIAMYKAKERGRNTFALFTPELNVAINARLNQEKSMRKAIEREEFIVHFQPIIDLRTRRLHGVEALARWNHPVLGLLEPETFIPDAEANGLIVRIGELILRQACAQAQAWREAGCDQLHLAVNLSARQFHGSSLTSQVRSALAESKFPAALLELEITESAAMSDTAQSIEVMQELRRMGARIALDDFGTGYSSLSYLRRFPVDAVKIDRSFVQGIMRDGDDRTIACAVIGMAHSLGLIVIAEGVETQEQMEFLRSEGAEFGQGFLFSEPRSAQDIGAYLDSGATW